MWSQRWMVLSTASWTRSAVSPNARAHRGSFPCAQRRSIGIWRRRSALSAERSPRFARTIRSVDDTCRGNSFAIVVRVGGYHRLYRPQNSQLFFVCRIRRLGPRIVSTVSRNRSPGHVPLGFSLCTRTARSTRETDCSSGDDSVEKRLYEEGKVCDV